MTVIYQELPVYSTGSAPAELLTRAQLGAARRRLRPGQKSRPRAWLYCMPRHHHAPLYALEQTTAQPEPTSAQLAALTAGRQSWWKQRACAHCDEIHKGWCDQEMFAMLRQDREAASEWARRVIGDPTSVVLDTETTGLHDGARIVEIAVLGVDGEVLLDSLVNPGVPIPAEATRIHGITDHMVQAAPNFSDLLVPLTEALHGRKVVIYNQQFDKRRLAVELHRHYRTRFVNLEKPRCGRRRIHPAARAWLAAQSWEACAMESYAEWCGDWTWDYEARDDEPLYRQGDYKWQPLPSAGHRAADDCRAVIHVLKEMTGSA
ncbi:3'-5' exonuclease [Streptomyces sp. NBC_01549]|uniref:3'-5' exonuclease n=1 Tax=Streptomyces sp. NBC_01549 TaxID=2975874 RepID=UPI0022582F66|nr:3'-5' exonuclease [Streptomyces sp. NBC_01549]MCX4596066.1 3'-5' exonuclease [Streptomyces sp. NBC_01549]